MAGGAVGFYSGKLSGPPFPLRDAGNLKTLTADMKALKPTILPTVPRFLNRLYDACVTTANKSSLFRLSSTT